LVVNNKWDRNIPIDILKKWVKFITPDYKINFNELKHSKLESNITFFYNEYDNRPKTLPITYNTTLLVTQLLKSSFPTYFTGVIQQCGVYYNLTTCTNEEVNIFDYFLESKSNKDDYPMSIDNEGWLKENFLALLFHFIFLKINETFEKKCDYDNPIVASLYILDYIKYAEISEQKIIELLRYTKKIIYFDDLIKQLIYFLNEVKGKLQKNIFNPKLYYLDKENKQFIIRNNASYYNYLNKKFVSTSDNIEKPRLTSYNTYWENDIPVISIDNANILKKILEANYYAFLYINNEQKNNGKHVIITSINEKYNLKIKNIWEEKDKCLNGVNTDGYFNLIVAGMGNGESILFCDGEFQGL
jgi:hypothetical protein